MDWQPFWLTAQLATVTTLLLLVLCIPLAWWLVFVAPHRQHRRKTVVEVLCNLPLVLPPTVLGFYLLLLFSPNAWLGRWLEQQFALRLPFSFAGLVLGSVLFSLPFMLQPLLGSFRQLPPSLLEASRCCGKRDWQTL